MLQNDFWSRSGKTLFSDQAPTEKIDSQNHPFGFYYCPFSPIQRLGRDFCNRIDDPGEEARMVRDISNSEIV